MKAILIGGTGQLGKYISINKPSEVNLLIPKRNELDLTKEIEITEYISDNKANWVINSAAFTDVDKAESNQEMAFKINAYGPEAIAKALVKTGGKLLQISTDYVFNGNQNIPYQIDQMTSPINIYGISKAEGENLIKKRLLENNQLSILRTSWLMSPQGNNFANKIINLLSRNDQIKVVYDQIGTPTTTLSLANAVWKIIEVNDEYSFKGKNFPKICHFSEDGIASWYDLSITLCEIGIEKGLFSKGKNIIPIRSIDYPTKAKRPYYSVLETQSTKQLLNIKGMHWRAALLKAFSENLVL